MKTMTTNVEKETPWKNFIIVSPEEAACQRAEPAATEADEAICQGAAGWRGAQEVSVLGGTASCCLASSR